MSVGSQVADAMRKLSEDRFEDAVVSVQVLHCQQVHGWSIQQPGTKLHAASSWRRTFLSSVRSAGCHSVSRNQSTSGIDGSIPESQA